MIDSSLLDSLWVIIAATLVFLMQPGFMCLESGLTRSKNSINVAVKNLIDFIISVLSFWLIGYGLMFGLSNGGFIGKTDFVIDFSRTDTSATFFFFQAMFCGTATTIFSGAVAERMRFVSYLIVAAILSSVIYPVFGHWAWNGLNNGLTDGWLNKAGFVDFAGSTVVHSIGGWVSLATLLVIGPRMGRFDNKQIYFGFNGSNLPLSVLGTFLLWIGWLGFNGGSTLAMNDDVPRIIAYTTLAGAAGAFSNLLAGYLLTRMPRVNFLINGSLGGLVAITANCHCVSAIGAVSIGLTAGVICLTVEMAMIKLKIDDAVGAVPVHLGCGIWGTLAVAIFGEHELIGTGLSFWQQLTVQLQGILAAFVVGFVVVYLLLRTINRHFPLRVCQEDEHNGLNYSEHGATTELIELCRAMDAQVLSHDLSIRMPVEPFTEVGIIAERYNQVMDSLENALSHTEAVVSLAKDAIITFVMDTLEIININPSGKMMFGFAEDSPIAGTKLSELFEPAEFLNAKQPLYRGKTVETIGRRQSGSFFPMQAIITDAGKGDNNFYIGTFRDITERKEFENQLYRQAFFDGLTEIPNRILFMERLERAIERRKRNTAYSYAVMLLDLDRFKWVNDILGHLTGDELLRQVSKRFVSCIRRGDTVARLGGDEFAVLIEDFDKQARVIEVAERLQKEAKRPFSVGKNDVHVSASIGIVLKTEEYQTTEAVLRDADIAMYRAKELGKARYQVFNRKLHEMVSQAMKLENELREAVEKKEFLLYFQPIVSVPDRTIVGVEALVRWDHPEKGLISPNVFIPVAEETGLIIDLGEWVLHEACSQMKWWQQVVPQAKDMKISVNLSAKQFLQDDLVAMIKRILDKTQLAATNLKIEITESVIMEGGTQTVGKLNAIREIGVNLSIDDFGTGYSSLSSLHCFPITELKIDRTFISDLEENTQAKAIIKTIVSLAHTLNLNLVAEGVETEGQFSILTTMQCDMAQGFLFAKPLSAKEITKCWHNQNGFEMRNV